MEEQQLIASCIRNERNAQKELVQKYAPVLLTVGRRYAYGIIEAQDILQDSFVQIFNHLQQYDSSKGKLVNWMSRIVINAALKNYRTEKRRLNGFHKTDEEELESISIDAEILCEMDVEHVMKIIAQIPQDYQRVFNLYVIDGFSHEEIAALLKIETVTSRSYLFRARKLLNSIMKNYKQIENGIQ